MRDPHPLFRRLCWNLLLVAIPFRYLIESTYRHGFPLLRFGDAIFVGLWFTMSCYDYFTSHRLLNWMYEDDDSDQVPVPAGIARDALDYDDRELALEARHLNYPW